jgi:indolepyruvate ferredoxin oxidoreductase beta subunit
VNTLLAPAFVVDFERPITIAVLAMGGQGGGVLTDWIVETAEHAGWAAQSTSVPGVAQRTGATIYYIETLPKRGGLSPVLCLMPTPGDVDIVLAAEFMEAGRSMLRGFVTPERTTLIASTHRNLAVSEKERPGDGIAPSEPVVDASSIAAKRAIVFDMESLAAQNGSVISAAMFGALAGADVLPFSLADFEAAIRSGGKGVEPSLRAFHAARARVKQPEPTHPIPTEPSDAPPSIPARTGIAALDGLLDRMRAECPAPTHQLVYAGLRRLTDYQDVAYAHAYLDRLAVIQAQDARLGGAAKSWALTAMAAKYLAIALSYDDVIRVADLKTRAARFARIDREVGKQHDQILYMTEFMHPRMEEVVGSLPAPIGLWLEQRPRLYRALDRVINRGRRVRTGTILWFLTLYAVAALRPLRPRLLRHRREIAHLDGWLALASEIAERDYHLAVEIIACRRLVKGYSDTHARGASKFDRVITQAAGLAGMPDSAAWLRRLRESALADEDGTMLEGAIRTVHSLTLPA